MTITKLTLQHFRGIKSGVFEFTGATTFTGTTIIVGPNASGKTSIIEAINLLATAQSFRAGKIEEMIEFDQQLARVKGTVVMPDDGDSHAGKNASLQGAEGDNETVGNDTVDAKTAPDSQAERLQLEVLLTRGLVQGKRTQRRLYSVNDVRRQKKTFTGQLLTVVFRPEDMRLVEGSPGRRRDFLDQPLSLIDRDYAYSLKTYTRALTRRNKLLWQISEGQAPRTALTYWDQTLLKHGQVIQQARRRFLTALNEVAFEINGSRTDQRTRVNNSSKSGMEIHHITFRTTYQQSVISVDRQDQYRDRAIAAKHSLIGPQKDDFTIAIHDPRAGPEPVDVTAYGSRGQQRLAVLWLKLGEVAFLYAQTGRQPVLLLDDILSELDDDSRHLVLAELGKRQTIITTTDQELADQVAADHAAEKLELSI